MCSELFDVHRSSNSCWMNEQAEPQSRELVGLKIILLMHLIKGTVHPKMEIYLHADGKFLELHI